MTTTHIPPLARGEACLRSWSSHLPPGEPLAELRREYFRGREAIDVLGELMASGVPSAALRARAWAVLAAGPTSEHDVKEAKR